MILLNLFLSFLKVGLFAVGGAYSFLPLIEKEVVQSHQWLSKEEFLDVLGVVKIFPGAISIKFATYTGYKIAGLRGAIVANLGNLSAPFIIILFATLLYTKYKELPSVKGAFSMIQLVVFAMILAVAFQVINLNQILNFRSLAVIVISFGILIYTKIDPAVIIIVAGLVGAFLAR